MKIAVTGGTGFVGGYFIDAALEAGHEVRALTRRAQDERPRLTWIPGDLANEEALQQLCENVDVAVHIAGVINAASRLGFYTGNVEGTRNVLAAAIKVPRFVHVSSLAAREPKLSVYGESKAEAEALVKARLADWVMVRPPAVYGPGDTETASVYKLIARGFALLPGDGRFSLIEVSDLAAALLALAETGKGEGQIFEIDDGRKNGCSHRELAEMIAAALDKQPVYVPLPAAALTLGAAIDTGLSKLRGRRPALSFDRAQYLAHADWTTDSSALRALGIWAPKVNAEDGIARTAKWYRDNGWL